MKKASSIVLVCLIFSWCGFIQVSAQSVVEPNAEQKKVLDKAIPIIIKVLDQFNGNDWELKSDFYSGNLLVSRNPDRPLDVDQNFEREYIVNENSPRYSQLLKPIYDSINNLMQQQPAPLSSIATLSGRAKALRNVTVYVYINRKVLDFLPDPKNDLKIPGVAIAQKAPGEYFNSNKGYSYWLCFGNWKTAKKFEFKHPNNTPFIENIVVIFFGAEDRAQELLHKTDWKILNEALSK